MRNSLKLGLDCDVGQRLSRTAALNRTQFSVTELCRQLVFRRSKEVLKMSIPTHRQCKVEIQNKTSSFTLCEPLVHLISGHCESPLPPTLRPTETGTALFVKTPDTACGSVAVFTYNILEESNRYIFRRMAVMFSVPYDFNIYSNWYAVGVFNKDKLCDEDLYKEMYYGEEHSFVRGKASGPSLTYKAGFDTIRVSMSDSYQPVLKVDLSDY
ncbi:DELTA-stichotoxin-She4b [Fundulus heteroclitus]|uniref:DELTA-stichotoxin-She4b n=1 Tax=Fundulus heteroclitus TaxID=8078 RepID=UPI00165B816E|nr:DELTA-stichotoxin-She4b [Fundulus heteroclitus]